MLKTLEKLGAAPYEMPLGAKRNPTSLIAFSTFPETVPDYHEDAENYIQKKLEYLKAKKKSKLDLE